jgi:signal transduction histidine kinase
MTKRGSRARPAREQSIRVLLAGLFVVPLASLLALWGFAASVTLSNAIQEHNFQSENRLFGGWAQSLSTQLAQERLQAFEWLSSGRPALDEPLLAQEQATNVAVRSFRSGLSSSPSGIVPSARPALASFNAQLNRLPSIRAAIASGRMTPLAAFQAYNTIIDDEFQLYADLVEVNNTPLYIQAAASVQAGRALEMAAREVTLVSGAFAAGGQMSRAEQILFTQTVANQRLLIGDALKVLDPSLGSGYRRAYASPAYATFAAIENKIVNSTGSKAPIPVKPLVFGAATIPLFNDFQAAEAQDRAALSSLGTSVGNRLLLEVLLAGGLGLVAVALSVFLMTWFGRRISRELTGLQGAALELATERLPRVVDRLSRGEDVDVAAEAAAPAAWRIAETARVAEAFSSVQRTAVEAAVGQARLRRGVSQVFRNLSWRSQSLLHRQLALLDGMERRSTEPETLAELFQLDHLTTRMRRHAEGLIILSGAAPGRGWSDPVPVIDVLRGAIAEVEDYTRVMVITESADAFAGSAVADVIHLLAELIENATTFSPASTEVTIKAGRVGNGFVVEVEDRGIGMSVADFAAANDKLANPPEFDLADSDRLGLFVVARLAAKHGIKITLRPSPYGGTQAIVLLPHAVVVVHDTIQAAANGTGPQLARPPLPGLPGQSLPGDGQPAERQTGEGEPADREPAEGQPAEGQPAEGEPAAGEPDLGAAAADGRPRLPTRVRQASIVPQLRDAVSVQAGQAPEPASTDDRTPAQSRTLVESLQHGWLRGRTDADRLDEPWPSAHRPEQPAAPAMPEDRELP